MRTMIYDSIQPLTPMREPAVVNVNDGLSSMKPINQALITSAHTVKKKKGTNKSDLQQQGQSQSTRSVQ